MSDGAQNLSRRDMMRLGATGVAAASIANLPVMADEKAASDKLPNKGLLKNNLNNFVVSRHASCTPIIV
jgi:hypothetical protein